MQPASTPLPTGAGAAMIVGAVVAIAGALLEWHVLSGATGSESINGVDSTAGLGTLGLAAIAAVFAIVFLVRATRTGGRGSSVTVVVLSALALLASAYSAFAPEAAITQFEAGDIAEQLGVSETRAKAVLEEAFDSGQLNASAEIGTYVSAGGALVALVGGILGIAYGRRRRQAVPAAPAATAYAPPPPPPSAP